jgi:hypothetical protein
MELSTGATTCLTVSTAPIPLVLARSWRGLVTCSFRELSGCLSPGSFAAFVLGSAGANTPPTGATRPTPLVAGSSTGLTGVIGSGGA